MEKSDFTKHVLQANPALELVLGTHLLVEKHLVNQIEISLKRPEAILNGNGPSFSVLVNIN